MTGKAKWEAPSDIPRFSGVLSTAGGVVFSGKLTGEFEAFDAETGNKLWQFKTGSGIEGQPITWSGYHVARFCLAFLLPRRVVALRKYCGTTASRHTRPFPPGRPKSQPANANGSASRS